MFVLEIIPFSRTAPQAPLSYRSVADLSPGTLVSIPLRKKTVLGLVVGSTPVLEAKSALKQASFSLSKSTDLAQGKLPSTVIEAAKNIALYHATTLGAVLSSLLIPALPQALQADFWKEQKKWCIRRMKRSGKHLAKKFFISRLILRVKIHLQSWLPK